MEKLLNRLLEQRAHLAASALMHPTDKTEFEYGRVAGLYQGLTTAIEAVQNVLADGDEDE